MFSANSDVFLESEVNGEVLTPRVRIVAAAFSLNSRTLDGLGTSAFMSSAGNGAFALKAVRQRMIVKGWSRSTINQSIGRIRRCFKWAVENEGVGPDVEVENWPKDVIAGRDPQLERAVTEALKLINAKPSDRAKREPPPPVWGKRGPPMR